MEIFGRTKDGAHWPEVVPRLARELLPLRARTAELLEALFEAVAEFCGWRAGFCKHPKNLKKRCDISTCPLDGVKKVRKELGDGNRD